MINFKNVISNLPKRADLPPYKGLSYIDILKMNIPPNNRPVQKTLKNKFGYILSFLDYCEGNGYIEIDHRKPFRLMYKNRSRKDSKDRVPYNHDDLKKNLKV